MLCGFCRTFLSGRRYKRFAFGHSVGYRNFEVFKLKLEVYLKFLYDRR